LTRELIAKHITPRFCNAVLDELSDAARLPRIDGEIAFATDSFVVSPLFFPGGDIGSLAVTGTLNDLSVAGAEPLWLSVSLILEEGLPLETLDRVLQSLAETTRRAAVQVVAGDTKVVPRGAADKMFINTSGIGRYLGSIRSDVKILQPGDALIVTGPIGQHGMAVLAARESFGLQSEIVSDCAWLGPAVQALANAGVSVRAMRDATRGGVAAVLHEWAIASGYTLRVEEKKIPVQPEVRGMCELLGLDPLFVANEGTMLIAVAPNEVERALAVLQQIPVARQAACIGQVMQRDLAPVTVVRSLGREVPLDEPAGAFLPRIC
jgi:hydrogenase expression/formation protein HypE